MERTREQIIRHYQCEKELAKQLKNASREERKRLYSTMYDELFAAVPDHPRLTRRANQKASTENINKQLRIIRRYLAKDTVFAEFASGDCRLCCAIARRVKRVYGIDISDQTENKNSKPKNFELILYDGYNLKLENKADVFFSDQLIEHIPEDETENHFKLVRENLKKGGVYIFKVPHRQSGPHDVSKYFSDVAEGFHLNEPLYSEMIQILIKQGFSSWKCYWTAKRITLRLPYVYFLVMEKILHPLPKKFKRKLAHLLIPCILIIAE